MYFVLHDVSTGSAGKEEFGEKVTYCGNENDLLCWDRCMNSVVPVDEMDCDEA
jgi:hypothetical protein